MSSTLPRFLRGAMGRISEVFKLEREKGRKVFIPFITAGDPNLDVTRRLVLLLEEKGADIIELGVPFSDPLADGPVIQRASQRALAGKINFKDFGKIDVTHLGPVFNEITLECVKEARKNSKIVSLDVQGFVRSLKNKEVIKKFWSEKEDFLKHVDLVKISGYEIDSISKKKNYEDVFDELLSFGVKVVELTLAVGWWGMLARLFVPLEVEVDEQSAGSTSDLVGRRDTRKS